MIEATRAFVCVRPDTFESKEVQNKIRELLNGRLENTAFCILAPDGETRLSQSGRGLTRDVGSAAGLQRIASRFKSTLPIEEALTPDFGSFRLALNISSADSRVLLVTFAPEKDITSVEKRLRPVAWNEKIIGRFHFDLETDASKLEEPLSLKAPVQPGFYIVEPSEFGVSGTVKKFLPLNSPTSEIVREMSIANSEYAVFTTRKTYQAHVNAAMIKGLFFEMPMPFGEDRDGDGHPDRESASRYQRSKARASQIIAVD